MKRYRFLTLGMTVLFSTILFFNSCKKEDPITPTLQFIAEVDGYEVTITVEATGAESYLWDYDDGNISATAGSHTYSYEDAGSGDYTISCTVTSKDALEATKTQDVTIAASIEEIIAGVGEDGKTWILTQAESSYTGKMGGGGVTNDVAIYPNMSLIPDGVLTLFGLGDVHASMGDGEISITGIEIWARTLAAFPDLPTELCGAMDSDAADV